MDLTCLHLGSKASLWLIGVDDHIIIFENVLLLLVPEDTVHKGTKSENPLSPPLYVTIFHTVV